jgi:phosphatidate cytidylyltransferase
VLLAAAYLGVLPGFYLQLRALGTAWLVAGVMLVTKACDIGAYFTGRSLGRRKLIPWLSPGKTVEGLIGGLAFSGLVALGLAAAGNRWGLVGERTLPLAWAAAAGVIIGGLGHVGDLLESLLKRDAGVKDSGQSVPGFGGVLDVVDSPLLVAPLAYWLLA